MENRTVAEIDLNALRHNFMQMKQKVGDTKVMSMVKADAYGHGLLPVVSALKNLTDAFGVHSFETAMTIRAHHPSVHIILLSGVLDLSAAKAAQSHHFDLVLHNFAQVRMLEDLPSHTPVRVWVKINTGMHRLGFPVEQVSRVYEQLQLLEQVKQPYYWMTHFSESSNIASQETNKQLARFTAAVGCYPGEKSAANSAAILAWPNSYYEWVRPGKMLYGGSPLDHQSAQEQQLLPVMTLKSRVIAFQHVKKGDCLGYDRTWMCERDSDIAIISIGYGDGYPRSAAFGTPVLIQGKRYPVVGRVCMDLIHVDITGSDVIALGDEVILWGKGLPVDEVARYAGTVSYELCCHVSARVRRDYINCKQEEVICAES